MKCKPIVNNVSIPLFFLRWTIPSKEEYAKENKYTELNDVKNSHFESIQKRSLVPVVKDPNCTILDETHCSNSWRDKTPEASYTRYWTNHQLN